MDPEAGQAQFGTRQGLLVVRPPEDSTLDLRAYDVIVDIRRDSPTYKHWIAVELAADEGRMLYIPEGFAHGFQTLEDGSEVFYQMSEMYHPECARGLRWNDPALGIRWSLPDPIVSERDARYADLQA